ncbi:MAG: hypothetical protein ACK5PW_19670 [Burkholderiales bacterium]|jgi:hypothetical protein
MTTRVCLILITTAVAAALLAACGGGTSTAPATPASSAAAGGSGTQVAAGTITGFGSVIVDGVRCDDSGATLIAASEGRSVDVEGSMVAGVLKATKLRLR